MKSCGWVIPKNDSRNFPAKRSARWAVLAQLGGLADHAKPFHGVGSGVFEIAERQDKNAYRLVYAVQLGAKLYVLHAFQKKSKTGISTPQLDVDLIKQRYQAAQELAQHDPGNRI